jgi:glutathione S-transferase
MEYDLLFSMSLSLYYHPLASFCWKPLIALYENATPFTPLLVDLGNEKSRTDFLKIWPMGEFPVLSDNKKKRIVPGSTAIIEYLAQTYPGSVALLPLLSEEALEAREWNAFFDSYVHEPMQKIVGDVLRPEGSKDPAGVQEARVTLKTAYDLLEMRMQSRQWATGSSFSLADCAASPALFYADKVQSFGNTHTCLAAYLERLKQRPSFARVLREAEPYFHMFPYKF